MILSSILILYILALDGTAIIVAAIGGFFSLCGLVFIALINRKQNNIKKQLDGVTSNRIDTAVKKAEADTKLQVIAVINPN